MALGQLAYFPEYNNILSPVHAGLDLIRSTADQVLLRTEFIADFFHQSKSVARTVLATVNFAKVFDMAFCPSH